MAHDNATERQFHEINLGRSSRSLLGAGFEQCSRSFSYSVSTTVDQEECCRWFVGPVALGPVYRYPMIVLSSLGWFLISPIRDRRSMPRRSIRGESIGRTGSSSASSSPQRESSLHGRFPDLPSSIIFV